MDTVMDTVMDTRIGFCIHVVCILCWSVQGPDGHLHLSGCMYGRPPGAPLLPIPQTLESLARDKTPSSPVIIRLYSYCMHTVCIPSMCWALAPLCYIGEGAVSVGSWIPGTPIDAPSGAH
jgi:hypothetical protein